MKMKFIDKNKFIKNFMMNKRLNQLLNILNFKENSLFKVIH